MSGRVPRRRTSVPRALADLVEDTLAELSSRRARALMMVAAVGLSTGALLASAGISAVASRQIGSDIAASTLDLVTVSVAPGGGGAVDDAAPPAASGGGVDDGPAEPAGLVLPEDTEERLARVDLVAGAGRRLDVSQVVDPVVTRLARGGSAGGGAPGSGEEDPAAPDLVAVTAGYLEAAATRGPAERFFHLDGDLPVAFLGRGAARALDVPVTGDPTGLQVWVDGAPYDVVGYLDGDGPAALGDAVVVPYAAGLAMTGGDSEATVLIRSVPGAGAQVAKVAATAIRPDAPERLATSPVVSVDSLRRGVSTQLDRLAAWTGVILLCLTVLLIANSMVVAVTARTAEIGLRRALGSSRAQVAGVFLTEGALIGLLGGLVGAALAAAAVVVTAAANSWTAVLVPEWIAAGPLIGTAVGLVASAYPALRAAAVQPALAVRSE
ncbi:ABC transporter permease [Myceligenerans crystallogenes]|uniref:ABC3 transporter permease C-terminal domain-containing protein n=1 Tax=Myceligenerans crystallogenes TaxID=316335 RepID=A0ABN2NF27_9MICO